MQFKRLEWFFFAFPRKRQICWCFICLIFGRVELEQIHLYMFHLASRNGPWMADWLALAFVFFDVLVGFFIAWLTPDAWSTCASFLIYNLDIEFVWKKRKRIRRHNQLNLICKFELWSSSWRSFCVLRIFQMRQFSRYFIYTYLLIFANYA